MAQVGAKTSENECAGAGTSGGVVLRVGMCAGRRACTSTARGLGAQMRVQTQMEVKELLWCKPRVASACVPALMSECASVLSMWKRGRL